MGGGNIRTGSILHFPAATLSFPAPPPHCSPLISMKWYSGGMGDLRNYMSGVCSKKGKLVETAPPSISRKCSWILTLGVYIKPSMQQMHASSYANAMVGAGSSFQTYICLG